MNLFQYDSRIEFIFQSDSKNCLRLVNITRRIEHSFWMSQWIEPFFRWLKRIEPWFLKYDWKTWALFQRYDFQEFNLFEKCDSLRLNFISMIQRIFFENDSQNQGLISSIWLKYLNMTQNIKPLFQYYSKNWIFLVKYDSQNSEN